MGWKQWTAVVAVVGLGIVFQIPGHDEGAMHHAASDRDGSPVTGPAAEHLRTVVLDVTGMT